MRQKLRDHPNRTVEIRVDFPDHVGEIIGAVAEADLAHDSRVIDEDIESRELADHRFV